MSVFGIILVRIFPHFSRIWTEDGEMRTRITPNTVTFYVVEHFSLSKNIFKKMPVNILNTPWKELLVYKTLWKNFLYFVFVWWFKLKVFHFIQFVATNYYQLGQWNLISFARENWLYWSLNPETVVLVTNSWGQKIVRCSLKNYGT